MSDTQRASGSRCMVASGHPRATKAALALLAAGGSAVDAAIAADAVLGVVEPMATGIGGDLLAMVVEPDGTPWSYNGSGRSPQALTPARLTDLPGQRIPERHPLSVTTPGVVRGWHDLHRRGGRLPWSRLFEAAIEAADDGFPVAPVAAREWALFDGVLHAHEACAELYKAGRPPRAGERFVNPQLARTLRAIAGDGPDAFYRGVPAQAAAAAVQSLGGALDAIDFECHLGEFTEPLAAPFRGWQILECPPNTHGVAVLEALQELDRLEIDAHSPAAVVASVRATARALSRARETVADPSGNTVCTVVVDGEGRAVTLMTSVFKRFGCGIAAPGCGFVLQNRGFGFAAPGHINGAAPQKRPYHTVVPGAALKDGRWQASFGVVGGAMQPQGHVQLLLGLAAWQLPLRSVVDAPRWRLESDSEVAVEEGMPEDIVRALRAAGFDPPRSRGELGGRSDFGGAQIAIRCDDGSLRGVSDRRKDGIALGL